MELTLNSYHLVSQHGHLHQDVLGHEFNGTSDYIELPSHWGGPKWHNMTVEAWIKPSGATGDFQAILSPKGLSFIHFQINAAGAGNITVYTDTGALILPIIPQEPYNQWRHVAVIVKSGATKLIIDGSQVGATNQKTFDHILPTDTLYIGRGYNDGRYFKGIIADVRVLHDREHADVHEDLYKHLVDKPEMRTTPAPDPEPDPAPVTTSNVFGFKSAHGKYISAQPDGTIICDRSWLMGWEKFSVEDAGNGKVGLKGAHGKYISAQPGGGITCGVTWLRGWEKFEMQESNGRVGFKGAHGKYISAQPDGSLTCDRDWLMDWELFGKESA